MDPRPEPYRAGEYIWRLWDKVKEHHPNLHLPLLIPESDLNHEMVRKAVMRAILELARRRSRRRVREMLQKDWIHSHTIDSMAKAILDNADDPNRVVEELSRVWMNSELREALMGKLEGSEIDLRRLIPSIITVTRDDGATRRYVIVPSSLYYTSRDEAIEMATKGWKDLLEFSYLLGGKRVEFDPSLLRHVESEQIARLLTTTTEGASLLYEKNPLRPHLVEALRRYADRRAEIEGKIIRRLIYDSELHGELYEILSRVSSPHFHKLFHPDLFPLLVDKEKREHVVKAVVAHPNLEPHHVAALLSEGPYDKELFEIAEKVANHVDLRHLRRIWDADVWMKELLAKVVERDPGEARLLLEKLPHLDRDVILKLEAEGILRESLSYPGHILERLASHPVWKDVVRASLPPEVVERMTSDFLDSVGINVPPDERAKFFRAVSPLLLKWEPGFHPVIPAIYPALGDDVDLLHELLQLYKRTGIPVPELRKLAAELRSNPELRAVLMEGRGLDRYFKLTGRSTNGEAVLDLLRQRLPIYRERKRPQRSVEDISKPLWGLIRKGRVEEAASLLKKYYSIQGKNVVLRKPLMEFLGVQANVMSLEKFKKALRKKLRYERARKVMDTLFPSAPKKRGPVIPGEEPPSRLMDVFSLTGADRLSEVKHLFDSIQSAIDAGEVEASREGDRVVLKFRKETHHSKAVFSKRLKNLLSRYSGERTAVVRRGDNVYIDVEALINLRKAAAASGHGLYDHKLFDTFNIAKLPSSSRSQRGRFSRRRS